MATAAAAAPGRISGANVLTRWMWTWVAIGILVVLVVVGFLVGIVSALENIDSNLAEANTAVSGAGGDVKPLPAHVADINGNLSAIDTSLKPKNTAVGIEATLEDAEEPADNFGAHDIFERVATVNGVAGNIRSDAGNINGSLKKTNGHLESSCTKLNATSPCQGRGHEPVQIQ